MVKLEQFRHGLRLLSLQRLLFVACGLGLVSADLPPLCAAGRLQDDVVVERDADLHQTTYTISAGDCRITWTVYESEANHGVIRHRSDCGLSLGDQAPMIGRLLRKLKASGIYTAEFRTLSWGRLYPDGARDLTLPLRLALAAKRAADWDAVRGRPRGGDINGWVRKLANENSIYAELSPVFRESGFEIRLAAVEKVLVQRARSLPFFERLREAGTRPEEKVPFDCQAWFSLRPAGKN